MNHDQAERIAIHFLAQFGIEASHLSESQDNTADLCASDAEGSKYYIEVKVKSHNPALWEDLSDRLASDEVISTEESLHRRNAIDNVLKHANEQLSATSNSDEDFRVIWMSFDGRDEDLRWSQVFATFYGIVFISPLFDNASKADHCYYFDHSFAYSHPDTDAVAICDGKTFQLCLNEFSPRYEALKATSFCQKVMQVGGVNDPPAIAKEGLAILLKSDVSRSKEHAVIEALKQQEGEPFVPVRLNRHSTHAAIGFSSL